MHNRNQSDLLPYEKLAILGIDRKKADSLPMEVKEKLMAGEVTPIMQVSINARNGSIITMPMKLQMTTDKNGAPALIAYPVRAELDRERNKVLNLTQQEAERLARGEVIHGNLFIYLLKAFQKHKQIINFFFKVHNCNFIFIFEYLIRLSTFNFL